MFQSSVIFGFSSVFSSFETSGAVASYGSFSSAAGAASALTPSLMDYSISIEAVGTYTVVALDSISALYRAFSSSYNFFLNATAS